MIIIKTFEKLSFFTLIILLLPILSGCIGSEEDIGEDFVFTSLDGEKKYLSDYRGKVVILDMWATWCTPCQYQMLELKKAYDNYSRDNLEILSINTDDNDNAQDIQEFLDVFKQYDYELEWIFGMDDGAIWEKYRINEPGGVPTLYIFDRNGKIYYSNEGYEPYSKLSLKIDEILNKN